MHTIDKALILLVAITVLIAVASAGYAISAPRTGESFTEFYILMENEDGNLVASGYPRNITEGDERTIVIGVSNQEQRAQDYTVLVLLQQFMGENRTQTVGEEQVVYQYSISDLAYNRTNRDRFSFTPNMTGQNLRLAFLLYKGDLPQNPTVENAYRELHIWLAVTPAENDTSSSIYNPNTLRLS